MVHILLLICIISLDTFFVCVSYGVEKIRIPFRSNLILASISTGFLIASSSVALVLAQVIPANVFQMIGFGFLFGLGLYTIFEKTIKRLLHRVFHNFFIDLYVDEKLADLDHSKSISSSEACFLGFTISCDSLVTGFSMVANHNLVPFVFLCNFVINILACTIGHFLGKKISQSISIDLSLVSGILLILLAFSKLFS